VIVRADNRLAEVPMTPVRCRRCAVEVQVRKSSWDQTSVQWDAAASGGCAERSKAEHLGAHGRHGLFLACGALSDTIIDAAREGELTVVDDTSQ
jgi:hypothetical protein